MKVTNQYPPSFGAKFINNVNIGKLCDGISGYLDCNACFVEIDPGNVSDIKALKDVSKTWSYAKFADNIYNAACELRNENELFRNNKVYALTVQQDKFEKLNENDILGLVHTGALEGDALFIEHLQVKPDIIYLNKPDYKGAGTAILNSLKNLTSKIFLFPAKEESVKNFYVLNGFFEYPPASNIFTWVKDIFPRF